MDSDCNDETLPDGTEFICLPKDQIQEELVINDFFGKTITVAGLLTGRDIINEIKKHDKRDYLIIPRAMLRSDHTVLLDDLDVSDLEEQLNMKVLIAENDGENLVDLILYGKSKQK